MKEVATAVSAQLLDAARASGWRVRPDLAAAGLDEARLRASRGWISWREYVALLEALAGPGASPEVHAELGALVMSHSARTPFRHVGRIVGGAGPLIEATYGWVLQSSIPVLRSAVGALGPRRIRVRLDLEPGLVSGRPFFYSAQGTMRRLPSVLGLPDATVDAEVSDASATYDIGLAESGSLFRRVRRRVDELLDRHGQEEALEHVRAHVSATIDNLAQANERLSIAESRWRALVDGLPGMVAIVGAEGEIAEIHGTTMPAGVEIGQRWAGLFLPDDEPLVAEQIRRAHTPALAPLEVRTASVGQGLRWWACRVGPSPGEEGRVVVVALDVTERHRAEEALRESERRFLHAQKMEAIGRLSSGLAHDINNMLTAVQGQAEILRRKLSHVDIVVGAATEILDAVGRASALTRRLLSSGRAPATDAAGVDLGAYLAQSRSLLRQVIGEDVTLLTTLDDAPMPLTIDDSRLEQIVVNLAVNARDALPGGGRMTISAELTPDGGAALLTVTDDGIGMPPDVLARAAEPFFTTKPMGLGSGLGLATVQGIVEAAGGSLAIDSAPGAGTTVRVRLPLGRGPRRRPAWTGPAAVTGQRVLLVEDQGEVREMVQQMLELQGFRVHACPNADAALQAVGPDVTDIDALVTDIVMPGLSGRMLARALRERRPDLPVVLMSGFTDEDTEDLGGTTPHVFLAKPFSMVELGKALQGLLRRA